VEIKNIIILTRKCLNKLIFFRKQGFHENRRSQKEYYKTHNIYCRAYNALIDKKGLKFAERVEFGVKKWN
jgi:hypothetical protein